MQCNLRDEVSLPFYQADTILLVWGQESSPARCLANRGPPLASVVVLAIFPTKTEKKKSALHHRRSDLVAVSSYSIQGGEEHTHDRTCLHVCTLCSINAAFGQTSGIIVGHPVLQTLTEYWLSMTPGQIDTQLPNDIRNMAPPTGNSENGDAISELSAPPPPSLKASIDDRARAREAG